MQTWSISGIDLHLDLRGTRVRAALETALRDAVRTGRLGAGMRLPSSRALADDLGISRNTIAIAYGQLVAEGWLTAQQGSGTRVASRAVAIEAPSAPSAPDAIRVRYDLSTGSPDLAAFPRAGWLAAARRALGATSSEAMGYGDPRGRPELRLALAEYLARARGVYADPDRIVVCSGFTQGLALLCQVLRARGATNLATEAYGHQIHRDAIVASGLRVAPVPVDADGAVVSQFANADAALLTPAHQFPLGPALAAERRTQATEWARETDGLIIEDDYDGEFRYDRQPVGAMQALAPEHVVYAGTATKSLAPGLRLGWLVLPERLLADIAATKALAGGPSSLDQLTLAEFITSGAYDRHVRRCRLVYRGRRDKLVAALQAHAPEVRLAGIVAGLHVVVELPAGQSEDDVVARAREHGLRIEGLASYKAAGAADERRPALVVGYATPPAHAFDEAVATLCSVL
jgi:GntR family transcriptional regulator / MocR family aminotransferase